MKHSPLIATGLTSGMITKSIQFDFESYTNFEVTVQSSES